MRRAFGLMLAALLLLAAGCGEAKKPPQWGYALYFCEGEPGVRGAALKKEYSLITENARVTPGRLLRALLKGPESDSLYSPFPENLTILGWSWGEKDPGTVRVIFSWEYSLLTGIDRTLADYAVVLTLGQLEGVERVEIGVAGYMFRSYAVGENSGVMLADEAITAELDKSSG